MAQVDREWLVEAHGPTEEICIPMATLSGGPGAQDVTLAVIAGMHPGEAAGMLAAIDLIQHLARHDINGRVKILPIASTRAFYSRALQLSPVDELECHYQQPGTTDGTYSEHLIDLLFRNVVDADAVLDLHGGELVQDLTPYVGVPWRGSEDEMWTASLALARCFPVPFIDRRDVTDSGVGLPVALLEAGVPNIWTEIGRNGLPESDAIATQSQGMLGVLGHLGILAPSEDVHADARVVGPQHWVAFATASGVWRPRVRAGQRVRHGEVLGVITDVFGDVIEEHVAPGNGLIEYVTTSPAIDHSRRPSGNRWHQLLAQIVADDGDLGAEAGA